MPSHPTRPEPVHPLRLGLAVLALLSTGAAAAIAQPAKAVSLPVPGIDVLHPVTPFIATGTNPRAEGMEALRAAGFATVISFSEDTEPGYDRAGLERAAAQAGLRFVSIPFNRERPDRAAVTRFLEVMGATDTSPAYLACHTGQRAAMMWLVKRVAHDGWSWPQALAEARTLGLARPELEQFAADFLEVAPAR